MKKIVLAAVLAIVILAGVMVYKTATFTSRQTVVEEASPARVDARAAAANLEGFARSVGFYIRMIENSN